MPLYEYVDKDTGTAVELIRSVARRDVVPHNLVRIPVPRKVGILGPAADFFTQEQKTQRGLKHMEETIGIREIERQSGYSARTLKRVWYEGPPDPEPMPT